MTKPHTRKTGKLLMSEQQKQQQQQRQQEQYEEQNEINGDDFQLPPNEDLETTSTPTDDNPLDADDVEDEVNSCSSFSLQECINEFRARRIRRISTHSRDIAGAGGDDVTAARKHSIDPTDVDLINQNRSNKEQERKCKPCKNGFCYCFTSDSGDGGRSANVKEQHITTTTRGLNARQQRRGKKSENGQFGHVLKSCCAANKTSAERRRSAPPNLKAAVPQPKTPQKTNNNNNSNNNNNNTIKNKTCSISPRSDEQLTAVSRMTTTTKDAPLIHIIQELRDNCVISEVRVNKNKLKAQQQQQQQLTPTQQQEQTPSNSSSGRSNKITTHKKMSFQTETEQQPEELSILSSPLKMQPTPTAPTLEQIDETLSEETIADDMEQTVTSLNTSIKSNMDNPRRRHSAGGRLLQKRLSQTHSQMKPRKNFAQPPPKPPRLSAVVFNDEKLSISTLSSTSSSVREAERVVDEFLRMNGVKIPGEKRKNETLQNKKLSERGTQCNEDSFNKTMDLDKRRSFPMYKNDIKKNYHKPLPTYPSLSDIERTVGVKRKSGHYAKNICQITADKSIKDLTFGWQEPKINEMLNYDANGNQKQFKSQSSQAGPQSMGWQIPPKLELDTVDAGVGHNLASNIEDKHTPVKQRLFPKTNGSDSKKSHWSEQWRNFSPWTYKYNKRSENNTRKSNLKSTSTAFYRASKKKILRLVSPKKDNEQPSLCNAAVQTLPIDMRAFELSIPQSPPGSYHSAIQQRSQQLSTTTTTTPSQSDTMMMMMMQNNDDADTQFDFKRKVRSPRKTQTTRMRGNSQRKLNFPLNCNGGNSCFSVNCVHNSSFEGSAAMPALSKSYRSYHNELDEDITVSKMGYILRNIRAKLEASDEHAIRTFQEIRNRENRATTAGVDVTDGHHQHQQHSQHQQHQHSQHQQHQQHHRHHHHHQQQQRQQFNHNNNSTNFLRAQTRVDVHRNHIRADTRYNEPIYSEIEEDSIHITESPDYDNKTGIESASTTTTATTTIAATAEAPSTTKKLEVLYAKVNKPPKNVQKSPKKPTALGKLLHDSLKYQQFIIQSPPLPPLPEPADSEVSYTTIPSSLPAPPEFSSDHCQSLNNIRVMEHNSPPKKNRHLSKSELSLYRSDIFLDNLCRGEIIVGQNELERLEKIQNESRLSLQSESVENVIAPQLDDTVSYSVPNAEEFDDEVDFDSIGTNSQMLCMSILSSPHTHNQSTPKKQQHSPTSIQNFTTKVEIFLDSY